MISAVISLTRAHQTCSQVQRCHRLMSMFLKFLSKCHHRLHISTGSIDHDGNAHTWLRWIPDTTQHMTCILQQSWPVSTCFNPCFSHISHCKHLLTRIVNTLVEHQTLMAYQQTRLAVAPCRATNR